MATNASATTASIMVKPLSALCLDRILPDNFHASRQPVHPHLECAVVPRQPDRSATRHAAGEEGDGRQRGPVIAALRQQRVEYHVVLNPNRMRTRPGPD